MFVQPHVSLISLIQVLIFILLVWYASLVTYNSHISLISIHMLVWSLSSLSFFLSLLRFPHLLSQYRVDLAPLLEQRRLLTIQGSAPLALQAGGPGAPLAVCAAFSKV